MSRCSNYGVNYSALVKRPLSIDTILLIEQWVEMNSKGVCIQTRIVLRFHKFFAVLHTYDFSQISPTSVVKWNETKYKIAIH